MSNNQPISKVYFAKRLVDLCLRSGLSDFPKDDRDQHILLKSATLFLGKPRVFSEKEINAILGSWIDQVGKIKYVDQAFLRRRLVDTGYLTRNKDGSSYQIAQPGPRPGFFEASIDQVDVLEVIETARQDMERRKREYLQKSKGS
jgi:hypothetical protein